MKLTKENVYVNLQGKTEELTELYWLLKSNNEEILNDGLDVFIRCYLNRDYKFHFIGNCWSCACSSVAVSKTGVTIEQLKEILQPMENKGDQLRKEAKERGYTYDNFKCLINKELEGVEDVNKWYYSDLHDRLYTMPLGKGGNVVFENGVWAEIVTLKQQLQKAEEEVKRLKKLLNIVKLK